MSLLDAGVDAVESVLEYIGRYMVGKDLASYCELTTSIGLTDDDIRRNPEETEAHVVVGEDNTLLTVFDLQGTFQILSAADFDKLIDNLRIKLNASFRGPGHSVTFGFEKDPDRAMDELMRLAEPQLKSARRMGLSSEDIILDRVRRNAPLVAWEQNLLVVYTHMSVLGSEEARVALTTRANAARIHNLPRLAYGQNPAAVITALKHRHETFVDRIKEDFNKAGTEGRPGILLRKLSAREAIKRVRIMLNRERTSQKYQPVLAGDRMIPHGREDAKDYSDLVAPQLKYQVCTNNVATKKELVVTDEYVHGTLSLELGPQESQPFSELFASIDREIPWRVRIDLAPDGLSMMRGRQLMTSFVAMIPGNREIKDAFDDLNERSKTDAICSMKFTASTWSTSVDETRRRMGSLEKALQAWGICNVTSVHGDPVAAWASTIPGLTTKNVANRLVPPLKDALALMPLQRPATPWGDSGSMIFRTPDGKIFPVQIGSSLQDTWIDLIAATPGSGKSVLLNSMNSATVHRPGGRRLPLITIVDVGPSSKGLILCLRDALPEHRKNEAVYMRLENSTQYVVNPFDTLLGARFPTVRETEFLIDFLTLLCTEPTTKKAPASCDQVIQQLLTLAYEDKAHRSPHPYEPNVEPTVDAALEASGLLAKYDALWWSAATWYEVTDMLFSAGFIRETSAAHRQAVPVLADLTAYLKDESIRDMFSEAKLVTGEPLLSYMSRCFTVASSSYALFAGRTRFELSSETRVVAVDLDAVIGAKTPEGKLRTAVMYMFARQLAARNYFVRDETILPIVPTLYLDYHLKRVADVQDEQKTIAYDEFHNTDGQESFVQTIIKDSREGRKWGIRVVGSSQFLQDYPNDLLNAATAVYVMRGGNVDDERILKDKFNVSQEAITRLQREANGPSAAGGNFLAVFKTKVGQIVQMLTNTVGPIEMWAFSTTQEDVALRNRLYAALGPGIARKLLAERFPSGSAVPTLNVMRQSCADSDDTSVVEQLFRKLLSAHQMSVTAQQEMEQ